MIYCPKCGTANRDGSRFCNECGQRLSAQTQIKCPHCESLNSVQNVFCAECGGRLLVTPPSAPSPKTSPTIKGLSLPTKASATGDEQEAEDAGEPEKEDIPAWLRELGGRLSDKQEATGPVVPEGGAEIPDWLQDLHASLPKDAGTELSPADETQPEQAPDWLVELQPPAPTGDTEPQEEIEEKQVPDWLTKPQPHAPSGEAEPQEEIEEEQVPDWLAGLWPQAASGEAEPEEEEEATDWLAELKPPAPVGQIQPEEEIEEEQVPDWVAELWPSAVAGEAAPEEETEEEEAPDWLAEVQPPALPGETEPEEAIEEELLPDWLAELRPSAVAGEVAPGEETEEEETPDWLAEVQPPALPGETEPGEAGPEEAIEEELPPDWLAELRLSAQAGELEAGLGVAEVGETEEELPDWLTELRPPARAAELEAGPGSGAEEEEELPDWLIQLQPRIPEEEPEPEPTTPVTEIPEPEAPDWLADLGPSSEKPQPQAVEEDLTQGALVLDRLAGASGEPPTEPAPAGEEALPKEELPDWLVPTEADQGEETLVRAEIPAWLLELKPRELRREEEEETAGAQPLVEEPMENTGLLAGLKGILPVEMLIAQPRAAAVPKPAATRFADSPQARLFAEIVAQPPEAAPRALAQPAAQALSQVSRWILALALIAAVTVPLLLREPWFDRSVEPTPQIEGLYQSIESLSAGAPVLVAFDYDPATSDEMNVVAQAIVGHLMDRGARVVAVSLLPAGPATAESILESLAAGQPYANLGYLPGQVAAVRLLGQSLQTAQVRDYRGTPLADMEAMAGITTIQQFALIIDLAAVQDTLRWWIEQVGAPYRVPIGAGVSASVQPLALPYFETTSRQLVGVVGGVPDAATYDALRSGQDRLVGPLASRLDSQLAGHVVLVLVLLVGNAVYLVRGGTGRKH